MLFNFKEFFSTLDGLFNEKCKTHLNVKFESTSCNVKFYFEMFEFKYFKWKKKAFFD